VRKKTIINTIVIATLLLAVGVNIHERWNKTPEITDERVLKTFIPQADSFKKRQGPFLYFEIYSNHRLTGYAFNTKDLVPDAKGYSGPIEVLAAVDTACKITDLKILRSDETPDYSEDIAKPEFLGQFKGKGPGDGFIIGKDIEAVTRATISCAAISRTLDIAVHKMQGLINGTKLSEVKGARHLNLDIYFYITVLIITFLVVVFYLKMSWLRYTGLMISIIYFGFIKANFISMSNLSSIFLWNLPDPASNIAWYVFVISALVLTFLLGAFYCTYMCPFGGLQIFLNKIFRINIEISSRLAGNLRKIKFALLWILAMAALLLNNPNVVNYEPFSTVFLRKGNLIAWTIAGVVLILSLFHYRPFCRYFCAAGAFFEMLTECGRKVLGIDAKKR